MIKDSISRIISSLAVRLLPFYSRWGVPVFTFHSIETPDEKQNTVTSCTQLNQEGTSSIDLERCLAYVSSKYNAITLGELVHCLSEKRLPRNTVVITFDDGLRSQLEVAVPLLKKYNLPATFSPIACTFAFGVMPFQFQIFYLLDNTKKEFFHFGYGDILEEREYCLDDQGKRSIMNPGSPLRRAIVGGHIADSREILHQLEEVLEISCPPADDMFMTKDEIQALINEGHEIAAHSIWHAQPSLVDPKEWENEINENFRIMQNVFGKRDYCLVYPYGGRGAIDDRYLDIVRKSGFIGAASALPGINMAKIDLYKMRRLGPW